LFPAREELQELVTTLIFLGAKKKGLLLATIASEFLAGEAELQSRSDGAVVSVERCASAVQRKLLKHVLHDPCLTILQDSSKNDQSGG